MIGKKLHNGYIPEYVDIDNERYMFHMNLSNDKICELRDINNGTVPIIHYTCTVCYYNSKGEEIHQPIDLYLKPNPNNILD